MPHDIKDFSEFHLTVTPADDHALVAVAGELDIAHTDALDAALRRELTLGPVRLDLAELTFMDSSGVRLVDTLLRDVESEGWALTIAPELSPAVRRVLELTGMIELLPFAAVPSAGGSA